MIRPAVLLLLFTGTGNCCDSYRDVARDELLPPIRIILNSTDSQINDFACLFHRLGNVSEVYDMETNHCVQLLTLPADPFELHVLLLRADVSSALCEPRVYGPLPGVLQVRFAQEDPDNYGPENVVSLQLNSRGGHLLFDLDLDSEMDLVSLAVKNLLEIVEMPRRELPPQVESYQRVGELVANPAMSKQVEEARQKKRQEQTKSQPWTYIPVLLTLPLMVYATAVALYLGWDDAPMETIVGERDGTRRDKEETSRKETDPLLTSSSR